MAWRAKLPTACGKLIHSLCKKPKIDRFREFLMILSAFQPNLALKIQLLGEL
jgi:hypothetical protein